MNKQLLKTSGADVYPLGKNLEKPYGAGRFHPPTPLPLYVRGLNDHQKKNFVDLLLNYRN